MLRYSTTLFDSRLNFYSIPTFLFCAIHSVVRSQQTIFDASIYRSQRRDPNADGAVDFTAAQQKLAARYYSPETFG